MSARTAPSAPRRPAAEATGPEAPAGGDYVARWWSRAPDGRLRCDLCPRHCTLRDGQRGFCFVRVRRGDAIVLTTYGRSSGFALDPIEKKPLSHVLPGSTILSSAFRLTDSRRLSSPPEIQVPGCRMNSVSTRWRVQPGVSDGWVKGFIAAAPSATV